MLCGEKNCSKKSSKRLLAVKSGGASHRQGNNLSEPSTWTTLILAHGCPRSHQSGNLVMQENRSHELNSRFVNNHFDILVLEGFMDNPNSSNAKNIASRCRLSHNES